MKTNIKFILCVIIMTLFFEGTQDIYAKFYLTHFHPLNNSNCDEDAESDTDGPPMAESCVLPWDTGCWYVVQARVVGVNSCQYWDSTKPTNSATRFYVNTWSWTNTGFSAPNAIIFSANDTGWSWLWTIMRYTWDDGGLGCFNPMSGNITNWASITQTTEWDHKLYLCAKDVAGNQSITWSGSYKIDKTLPIVSNVRYANPIVASWGWTNNTTITLTWSGTDAISGTPPGRSQIKNFDIRVYRIFGAQNTPTLSDLYTTYPWVTPTAAEILANSYTFVIPGNSDGYAYKFAISPRDNAGNTWAYIGSADVARIDTTAPDINQLLGTSSSSQNMLAAASQSFTWDYNDTGAPVKIDFSFEADYDENAWDGIITPNPYAYTYTYTHDIKEIDRDRDVVVQGWREYTILVNKLCDKAGNCISIPSPLKTIKHYVYADVPNGSISSTSPGLTDGSAIADGTPKIFELFARDQFNNQVVPAPSISRSISMNMTNISNTMFLNQHTRSGPTSVYITPPSNFEAPLVLSPLTTQSFALPLSSNNWRYPIWIKAYTPTKDGYLAWDPISDPNAAFGFDANLVVSPSTIDPGRTFTQNIVPIFKPLYTTVINKDLKLGWFIEGTEQQSEIVIINNNTSISPTSPELQLEFNGTNSTSFTFFGWSTSAHTNSNQIAMRNAMVMNPSFTTTSPTNTNLYTKLLQNTNTTVSTLSNLQFSTHFGYTLDSKNIVYNSDIIGRAGYHDTSAPSPMGNQVWIKVIGPISSNVITALTMNQFDSETSIFSGLSRATVKNNMRKSIALATRNMISTTVSSVITDASHLDSGAWANGSKIDKWTNGSLMKFEKNGWFVTLNLSTGISGKRTIVIKWADLYVTNDMYYTSPDAILGVVVQKDDAGNGWNLYIDPSITNIVGTYIVEGSIMSSTNGSTPTGTSNIWLLKNQLYIYGSIVSENTIGGSRMSPPKCPSLMSSCASLANAQLYDLNYLRRYYLYNNVPFGWVTTKVIGWWRYVVSPGVSISPNASLIQKFTSLPSPYAAHPVIIEYNPRMRIDPPIGFDQMTD